MELDAFWSDEAKSIDWIKPFTKISDFSFKRPVHIKWFEDGQLNACYNCLDRHLPHRANQVAYYFEPDDPNMPSSKITYQELFDRVCRFANVLKSQGVKKGDRVTIYMPMIVDSVVAMLACARIGAIHSLVFGGFSPDSIRNRIEDCESEFVVTANEGRRGGKTVSLKENVDKALIGIQQNVKKVFVVKNTNFNCAMGERDVWMHQLLETASKDCPVEPMNAEDPLFLLYTSGSTNKPKGVLHTTGGYLVFIQYTFKTVFDIQPTDVYWCTADVGWVTGHSYIVYGPLACGATSVLFEGVPSYPTFSRFWEVVDKYKVSILYTAPTAIRALMKEGDGFVKKSSRKSLRLLGSVGEPINPEVWEWYSKVVGDSRCEIVDTWWQTETGGIMISPVPGKIKTKPGSATKPLPGTTAALLTPEGKVIEGEGEGLLVIPQSWPGQIRGVFKDQKRFEETYFSAYPGYYFSGDGCRRDSDGYYWITGRVDDVINVSGHRIGTAELESALVAHESLAEAAVVGFPHNIKGQGIYVFATLKTGIVGSDELKRELIQTVSQKIGPIAKPDIIQWAPNLPKTRSGKILRRILRKISEGAVDQLGDTSTLADTSVVEDLINEAAKLRR